MLGFLNRLFPHKITFHTVSLPLTDLHYMKYGSGEPLIIFPATISRLSNWTNLLQFMGDKYTAYFFELPGHGFSSAFRVPYKSELVARTFTDLLDALKLDTANVMGFSFGGILTLKTVLAFPERIRSLILYAPCISHKALRYSQSRLTVLKNLLPFFSQAKFQQLLLTAAHNQHTVNSLISFLQFAGRLERTMEIKETLLHLPPETLSTVVVQISEILTADFEGEDFSAASNIPLYFAMSVNDPLLDFHFTRDFLQKKFPNFKATRFDFPFHQLPKEYDYPYLKKNMGELLRTLNLGMSG
ncbi:MAG: hypothetical protein UV73_C0001G0258 [Candidatus Gottesmanbacteria bacterium GW2011_GWA2_43_14]|uniref:AB hydrolase-1 domain-containing protein n=1 Tax=Candidatus Gottesmanbacteria bacterium GW2011_GWA2_43_14 TaxID=1618443 RepID=A0A0G1DMG3_9BACT|nr:MAG: hypothetical protein UV73_C0001G0258 [Candidatus Gottesmanbacteria bacterium GW2011_GWA2_43_14]